MTQSDHVTQPRVLPEGRRWGKILGYPLLLASLVIVGLRPLIQETHDTARQPFAQVLSDLPELGPLPTLWINLVIVVIFGMTMALRSQGYLGRPRKTGLVLGFVVVAIAAAASCFVASNKRLAINATLDWLTLPLLAISLAYLLQHAWQIRLALCIIIASGVASAVESLDDYFVTQPATIELYEQNKEEIWSQKGVLPDSYQIDLFESRLRDHAAKGFFYLSNIAGNYFLLTIFSALALAFSQWRHKPFCAFILFLALTMITALLLTKSLGALVALAIGLAFGGLLYLFRCYIAARKRKALVFGWLTVIAGVASVATYGLKTGGLPGDSLTFRWWYLETTAKMVADHPLLGVGSEQYSRYYPRYKEIKSPEEINNPHNFLAHAAAEWGLPGLTGMILMLVGGSKVAAGIPPKAIAICGVRSADCKLTQSTVLLWGAGLSVAVWTVRILIVGHSDPTYIYASNAYPFFGWMIAFVICTATILSAHGLQSMGLWISVGLFSFLLHNLITFGLFIPGSATTFFALLAICIAVRNEEFTPAKTQASAKRDNSNQQSAVSGQQRLRRPFLLSPVVFVTLVAITLAYMSAIRPVSRSWQLLQHARSQVRDSASDPTSLYWPAFSSDLLDPTAARELARSWMAVPPEYYRNLSREKLDGLAAREAVRRDPEKVSNHRLVASVYLKKYLSLIAQGDPPENLRPPTDAADAYETVLKLYPTHPDDRLRMSEIQTLIYEATGDQQSLDHSIAELEKALQLDNQRDKNEVRRFSEEKVRRLETELARLKSLKSKTTNSKS